MAFNPNASYRSIVAHDGALFLSQGGAYYDLFGNSFSTLPKSKAGYAAPVDENLVAAFTSGSPTLTALTVANLSLAGALGMGFRASACAGAVEAQLATDGCLVCTPTATTTLTLLAASTANAGQLFVVITQAAFAVVSAGSNVLTLAGAVAGTAIVAATAGKFAVLQSTGAAWQIILAN